MRPRKIVASERVISLDIETRCARKTCVSPQCRHALSPSTGSISVIGIYYENDGEVIKKTFRSLDSLRATLLLLEPYTLLGHNFSFDLHFLNAKKLRLPLASWGHDTKLMSCSISRRVSDSFLKQYEKKRSGLNASLPPYSPQHRMGRRFSLKVLAPYFLGVEPFWENPLNHNDDEYVLLDCEYTYKLFEKFRKMLIEEDKWHFYLKNQMEWLRVLFYLERNDTSKTLLRLASSKLGEAYVIP